MSRHIYSNIGGGDGDIPRSDIAGGFSIEPSNYTEEPANPMSDDGGLRPVSAQAQQAASQTGVGDHNEEIREGGLKKYIGVSVSGSKWVAALSNSSSERKKNRVYLGTFPTAEMAAIAYDTSTLFLRGDASIPRLNFPQYSSDIKNVLKGCSSLDLSDANIRFVAWEGAHQLGPLLSPEKNDLALPATSAQQLPTQIPDYQEVSMNNTNNQQIQHGQSRSYMPAAADSVNAFSSFEHGPRHEFSTPADTIQDAAIPTSSPDSLPVEMENSAIPTSNPSSSTIQDVAIPTSNPDFMPENTMLMEYPSLRYSPDCVLLKPVPGANTHPDYIWKGYP